MSDGKRGCFAFRSPTGAISHEFRGILSNMRWLVLSIPLLASAASLQVTPNIIRQGETLRVTAPAGSASARLHGRTIRLFPHETSTFGLMPIPAAEPPGKYILEVLDGGNAVIASTEVTVRNAHYPSQNISINKTLSELKPEPGEAETVAAFRKLVTETRLWNEPFAVPVASCMTSRFGVRRLHNGRDTGNYHAGLDLRAREGDPIHATAAGTVVIARQFAVHGGTVGIDHGQGLGSIYLHMSKIKAVEGSKVERGEIVGYAGSTGRSTAPHLHWSVYVNGVPVSPLQWTPVRSCYSPVKPPRAKKR